MIESTDLHEYILKKLELDYNKISNDLSNQIFEECEDLETEISNAIDNKIEYIREEILEINLE